jgi:hypothetical protein
MRPSIIRSILLVVAGWGSLAFGQQQPPVDVKELLRQTVEHEIKANNGGAKFAFKDHKETAHGSQVSLMVETRDGSAGLLVATNGRPLTPDQRQAEDARLNALIHNSAELRKKQKSDREDTEHTARIMAALPDAFLYERNGTETGSEGLGHPGDELIKLKFRPNPRYVPPTHTEQVLTGMQGYMLIDAQEKRIAKIDGSLFKDVSFGWGILGRLDKGGHFLVQQGTVGDGKWEITRMDLSFTGKELLVKKLIIKSNEFFSDFRKAPSNLTFAEGVEFLRKQEAETADNRRENAVDELGPK